MNEKEIIKLAFYEELEKNAQVVAKILSGLSKVLSPASKFKPIGKFTKFLDEGAAAATTGGLKGAGKIFSGYGTPNFIKGPGGVVKSVGGKMHEGVNRGLFQREIGDFVNRLKAYGSGISNEKTMFGKAKRFGSNFLARTKQEFQNANYLKLDPKMSNKIFYKNGKPYIKDSIWAPKHEVVSQVMNGKPVGDLIIKRSPMGALLQKGMTPAGFGLTTAGLGIAAGGNPGESAKEGAKDMALWSTPLGQGKMLFYDLPKMVLGKKDDDEIS